VVFDDATPEEMERLRTVVRMMIDWLEKAALRDQDETQTEAECEPAAKPQPVQLSLEL
jgi:hypothetical protein